MLHMIGALLLILGATRLGLSFTAKLTARLATLQGLTDAFSWMERELSFSLAPMSKLFEVLSGQTQGSVAAFFARCARGLSDLNNTPFSQVWQKAAEDLEGLDQEDRRIVAELGLVLGRYDGEGQRQALAQAGARLNACMVQARSKRDRLGRVYTTLGVVTGIFAAILLL